MHKTNVLVHAGGLWQRTFDAVAAEFPDVTVDYCHVDAASMFLVTQPERFDVVVTDNLFGDILTDIGAAIAGGIGLAASGNLDPSRANPSMFEPVHGSAPDIAGQGKADPTATVLSVAMLLDHLGHAEPAARVRRRWRPTSRPAAGLRTSVDQRDRRCAGGGGRRLESGHDCTWTMQADLPTIELKPTDGPAGRRAAASRSWPSPVSAGSSPTTWCSIRWTRGPRLARRRAGRPYGPLPLDPATMCAALRAGDLRGAQGLPAARRLVATLPPAAPTPSASRRSARRLAMAELPDELFLGLDPRRS